MKRWMILMLALMLALYPVSAFASSKNTVDRVLAVKDDYEFKSGNAFARLRITEDYANDFGGGAEYFTIELVNAEWFEDGDDGDAAQIAAHTVVGGSNNSTIELDRISSRKMAVTITRGADNTDEEAYWMIPIYAQVTDAGDVNVVVDGRGGLVSSSTLKIADAIGDSFLPAGYEFNQSNKYWLTVKEPSGNAFGTADQVFRLELSTSEWFNDSDTRLSPQNMMDDAIISGVEYAEIKSVKRITDKIIEITVNRGEKSSITAEAVWSIPVYHVLTETSEAKIHVNPLNSMIVSESLTEDPVKEPIVEAIKRIRLQIGNPMIKELVGNTQTTVELDVSPINPSGSTLVPLRGILEALGADVAWNGETREVTITRNELNVVLAIDSVEAMVNGEMVTMIEPAQIVNERTLIPLRFVSENLGYKVIWFGETQEIEIYEE